ncbi:MAG: pyrroline-5-carboxylate reductase [Actinomycetota bacterium]
MSGSSSSVALVVVGGGNMGAALVGGLLSSGAVAASDLAIVEVLPARREQLTTMFPDVAVVSEVPSCSSAVIAVKPQHVSEAVASATARGARRVLSIAAGVTLNTLETAAGAGVAVVRSMPNTPAMVGEGASAIAVGAHAGEADVAWAEMILGSVGLVVRVDESHLDAVTGLAGSGPAYIFLVAEALIQAGVDVGLPADTVDVLVRQLLVGSAALLAEGDDPAVLRARVTSPGGTTAAGVSVLETNEVRAAFVAAVRAATERGRELGRQ